MRALSPNAAARLSIYLAFYALSFATLLCVFSSPLCAQAYKSNPHYKSAISDGKLLAENQDYDDAIASYREANEIAGGKDKTSLRASVELQISDGAYDDAIASAKRYEALASTTEEKAFAQANRGRSLFLKAEPQSGTRYDPALLRAADSAFRSALALDPKDSSALYLDGEVLAHLGETEAARARFKACLSSITPDDPIYRRAERFAEDPALALVQLAPAFAVTTLGGARFSLDQMKGKVILLDFWATWCGPCNEELPQIKKIARDFAGQPLVILSISWDEDPAIWKAFVEKNGLTWPQYRDTDRKLGQMFEVQALPSYFTIDSDGVISSALLGGGFDVEGRLRELVARAKAHAKPASNPLGD